METLRISCVTWNVETSWPDQDLSCLLGLNNKDELTEPFLPDIYVISLQEVKSQPQNVIMDTLFEEPWTTAFREVLGPRDYVRTTGERLQGLVVSVFVLRKHLHHMRDIYTTVTRTGLGGFWGNKGSACVRFSLYGCSICLVNCHLAPHDTGFEERCLNYNYIVDHASFPVSPTSNILYHDYVFWMGDLNYRLSGDITAEEIVKKILSKNIDDLVNIDELKHAQKGGKAFGPLIEGNLSFSPTYKYLTNSKSYDLNRRPAWCDRILHQVHVHAYENIKLGVDQSAYSSCPKYGQSDHKPVYANYNIKVFAHHHERCVRFKSLKQWEIGGINTVKYTLDADIETSPWDYIAIFKAKFSSVHQYVTYAYVPQATKIEPSPSKLQKTTSIPNTRCFQIIFNDELVQTPGSYTLLYYSGKYNCYLGICDTFEAVLKYSDPDGFAH